MKLNIDKCVLWFYSMTPLQNHQYSQQLQSILSCPSWTICKKAKLAPQVMSEENLNWNMLSRILEYAATVWDPHTRYAIYKLESAAHFVRSIYSQTSSVTEMLNSLKRNTIESQNKELCFHTFYKIIHNYVNLPFPNNMQNSSRATRATNWNLYRIWCLLTMSFSFEIIYN